MRPFPRRQAVTRRFTLGAPRNFSVSQDGRRVLFLRSAAGDDTVNSLWVFDVGRGTERLIFDATALDAPDNLPPAERARRERARESGSGIVGYTADSERRFVAFVIGGQIVVVDSVSGEKVRLESSRDAFDPVIAPDGSRVAYVSGGTLRITGQTGDSVLIAEPGDTVSWGSAEFIAGEEMGRTRGCWWSPDSSRLLVERVDVASVQKWWIAAPVSPDIAPAQVRYPAAGTDNAEVGLAVIDLDGRRVDVDWSVGGWEYLADASWTDEGLILTVQSRDQRSLAVLDVDPLTGGVTERYRAVDPCWVELVPGAPRLHDGRLITIEDRGEARKVCVDGVALTGDDVQIRRLVRADEAGLVVAASVDPTSIVIARVSWDGEIDWLTPPDGVSSAVVAGGTVVISRRSLEHEGTVTTVSGAGSGGQRIIVNNSEQPEITLNVSLHRLGSRDLALALLMPGDDSGHTPLPVLLDPYGGPHSQRVVQARGAFHASQWFADQGFAVLVVDGRGTPGRGPRFERAVRGDLATLALEDQISALMAAAEIEPRLDLTRVAIRGWSFGGYLAALAVLRRPDVFHAAIAGAPVSDWRLYDTHYTERYLGDPRDEPENYDITDLTAEVVPPSDRHPVRPLMLIHGLADDNVVAAHTLRLSRALLESGRSHSVLPLSGVTHMTPQEDVAENLLLLQLEFLREALR